MITELEEQPENLVQTQATNSAIRVRPAEGYCPHLG